MAQPPNTRYSLIARLANLADQEAWREFAQLYEPFVYRQARRAGLQHADAREAVQDVLCAVANSVEKFEEDSQRGRFRTWLYAIGRNTSLRYLGKLNRRDSGSGDSQIASVLADVPARDSAECRVLIDALRRHAFLYVAQQVRKEFQSKTWQAFWMTAVENHSIEKASELLQLSVGSIYIARSRVMARLRNKVQQITLDDFPEAISDLPDGIDSSSPVLSGG